MILTLPESLNLTQPVSQIAHRLAVGSEFVYNLHKSGARCTNIFKKYSCDICESSEKPLCKAIKLFIKLEREYYLLQIYDIILRYSQIERPEKKEPEIQMNLF